MPEIKELYVIEWMGPYKSLEDICKRKDTADCCIYLITGHVGRESNGIKYVGITKRLPEKRFSDKDHQKKPIREKLYWTGRFSVLAYNNLEKPRNRARAELVEHLIIKYLFDSNVNIDNKDKTQSLPKKPIGIISKWQKRETDDARLNKPSILRILPDILLYSDNKFWSAPKMRVDLE